MSDENPAVEIQRRIATMLADEKKKQAALPCRFGTKDLGSCTEQVAEVCPYRENGECPRTLAAPPKVRVSAAGSSLLRDEPVPVLISDRVLSGRLDENKSRALVRKFMDSHKSILVLFGPVRSGKTTAAVEALARVGGQYLRPLDLLQDGFTCPGIIRARKVPLTILDGLARDDLHADFSVMAATIRWLGEAAWEYGNKLIVTVDDEWFDRENPKNSEKPIRGISTLISAAGLARIQADGMIGQAQRL